MKQTHIRSQGRVAMGAQASLRTLSTGNQDLSPWKCPRLVRLVEGTRRLGRIEQGVLVKVPSAPATAVLHAALHIARSANGTITDK